MSNWLDRLIKYGGVIFIILFSSFSIFFSFIERSLPKDNTYKNYMKYSSSIENKFYDMRAPKEKLNETGIFDKDIVLLKVDDQSLQKLGSWPVSRLTWATTLNNLKEFGAKVVAFDIFFPEKSRTCGIENPDDTFSKAVTSFQEIKGNTVIFPYTIQSIDGHHDLFTEMPDSLYEFTLNSSQENETANLEAKKVERNTFTIEALLDASPSLAYINMLEDADGLFRHYSIVANVDGLLILPSMSLKAYQAYKGVEPNIKIDESGSGLLQLQDQNIFINYLGETKIRWTGSYQTYEEVSLADLVSSEVNKKKMSEIFNGKVVFIGSTATGAHDLRNTPIDAKLPGVYAHINMLTMLLNNYFYQDLSDSMKASYAILGVTTLVLIFFMFFNNAIADIFITMSLCAASFFIDQEYFINDGYEIRLFFITFNIIMTYSWITLLNFNAANDDKKRIKGAFSKYVAPSIVNDMLANPDKLSVGGERRDITCMFSDVRDFTSISERLSATELSSALNRYMGEMTDIVLKTNGTLDKYIGDAIVAFWGAPVDIGDHVTQAVHASIKMMEALPKVNEEFKSKGLPEFRVGIGLNSGECNVGNMGSDQIFAYTALGDTMNLGARLESSCKFYGAQILISEYTYDRLDSTQITARLIDKVQVKGKTQPVKVYEVMYNGHPLMSDADTLASFNVGYQAFLDRDFDKALFCFNEVLERYKEDKSSKRLIQACHEYIKSPPEEGFDHTVTVRTDK